MDTRVGTSLRKIKSHEQRAGHWHSEGGSGHFPLLAIWEHFLIDPKSNEESLKVFKCAGIISRVEFRKIPLAIEYWAGGSLRKDLLEGYGLPGRRC